MASKLKVIVISALIVFVLGQPKIHAQDQNYCNDKEGWKQWDQLVQKYPHDMDIQMLHVVRIGFCKKIKDGSITFEAARNAFNSLYEKVLKKAQKEEEQWLRSKQL